MGCQPDLLTGYQEVDDARVVERFERVWDGRCPPRGVHPPHMYEAAVGASRRSFILGENVVQTDPAPARWSPPAALQFLIVQELFLAETAALAHLVLPGASFLEKDGTFTNGERRIQRVRRAIDPPGQARADLQILCDLMAATGRPQPYAGPADIMDEIARVAPEFAGVTYDRLGQDGLQWPVAIRDIPAKPSFTSSCFPWAGPRWLASTTRPPRRSPAGPSRCCSSPGERWNTTTAAR